MSVLVLQLQSKINRAYQTHIRFKLKKKKQLVSRFVFGVNALDEWF